MIYPFTKSVEYSIGSSNISSLISQQNSTGHLYSNVVKTRRLIKSQEVLKFTKHQSNQVSEEDKYKNLKEDVLQQIVSQFETIFQISKALNSSYSQKNCSIDGIVEAEKILLVASKYISHLCRFKFTTILLPKLL